MTQKKPDKEPSNGMKLLLVTPLYPPDIAEPAPYTKELAKRLSTKYEVTILAYNQIPEAIAGVRIVTISKQSPLPLRLLRFVKALIHEAKHNDVILVQNGPSTELPAFIASFFTRTPFILRLGDERALAHARTHVFRNALLMRACGRAHSIIVHDEGYRIMQSSFPKMSAKFKQVKNPLPRPEILPFKDRPNIALASWETSWEEHVGALVPILNHE